MIKLVSNFELRLDQENVVEPSDFKRFTQQFGLSPDSEQVLTYLQATLKSAVYSTTAGPHLVWLYRIIPAVILLTALPRFADSTRIAYGV